MSEAIEVLRQALKLLRTERALCTALWVSDEELESYLNTGKQPPASVVSGAMDIVSAKGKPIR